MPRPEGSRVPLLWGSLPANGRAYRSAANVETVTTVTHPVRGRDRLSARSAGRVARHGMVTAGPGPSQASPSFVRAGGFEQLGLCTHAGGCPAQGVRGLRNAKLALGARPTLRLRRIDPPRLQVPMAKAPDHITIVYDDRDNKPVLAVTGAHGGPSPDSNSVVAHLYIEHITLPSLVTHNVNPAGVVDLQTGDGVKRGDITRFVVGTLVLSPEAAIALGMFLVTQGENAKAARGQDHA